jgi:hypothetical protein
MSDPFARSELEKRSTETTASTPLKFSVLRLALAFVIAGVSDVIGAYASLAPPIGWAAMAALAGAGPGSDTGRRGTSILAAGGWSNCCPRYSSTEVGTALTSVSPLLTPGVLGHKGWRFLRSPRGKRQEQASSPAIPELG